MPEELPLAKRAAILNVMKVIPQVVSGYAGPVGRNLGFNAFVVPTDGVKSKDVWELLDEIHPRIIILLLWLMEQYKDEKDGMLTIGVTNDLLRREWQYRGAGKLIERSTLNPPLNLECHVLYRSNSRFNCLMVEYLLQRHLKEKMWSRYFGGKMNLQKIVQPLNDTPKYFPSYVYVKCTTGQFNFANSCINIKFLSNFFFRYNFNLILIP